MICFERSITGTLPVPNWERLNLPPNPVGVSIDSYFVNVYAPEFGQALSEYLRHFEMTQQEAAELTGVPQPVIGRILKGAQPTSKTLQKLANGLGVYIPFFKHEETGLDSVSLRKKVTSNL